MVHSCFLAKAQEAVHREIALMQRLKHPNIVSYLGKEESIGQKGKEISVFMEWMPTSLFEMIQRMKRQEIPHFVDWQILRIGCQIAAGNFFNYDEGCLSQNKQRRNVTTPRNATYRDNSRQRGAYDTDEAEYNTTWRNITTLHNPTLRNAMPPNTA